MKQALLTSFITLLGAIVLFAISELMRGLYITPMLKVRELAGDIVDRVIYYSADLTSGAPIDQEREKKIREELRALSTQLRARAQMLSAYELWSFLKVVPSSKNIDICARQLIGLSNSFRTPDNPNLNDYFIPEIKHNLSYIVALQESLKLRTKIIPSLE